MWSSSSGQTQGALIVQLTNDNDKNVVGGSRGGFLTVVRVVVPVLHGDAYTEHTELWKQRVGRGGGGERRQRQPRRASLSHSSHSLLGLDFGNPP